MKTTMTTYLLKTLTPFPPNAILETEGVDIICNKAKEREIEVVDSETEGGDHETEVIDPDNAGVDNKVLPPERKGYSLSNPRNVNYSDKRAT